MSYLTDIAFRIEGIGDRFIAEEIVKGLSTSSDVVDDFTHSIRMVEDIFVITVYFEQIRLYAFDDPQSDAIWGWFEKYRKLARDADTNISGVQHLLIGEELTDLEVSYTGDMRFPLEIERRIIF